VAGHGMSDVQSRARASASSPPSHGGLSTEITYLRSMHVTKCTRPYLPSHLNTCNTRLDISHHTPLHSHDMLKRKSPYGSASPAPGIRGASAGVKAEGPDVKRVKGGLRAGCWVASVGALGVGTRLLGAAGPGSGYSPSHGCCERHALASSALLARLEGLKRGKGWRC
jgi:hypothetical protein